MADIGSTTVASRLRDTRRLVLDEAARQRRRRKALEALEADNFQADPHADLRASRLAPKFDEATSFGPTGSSSGGGEASSADQSGAAASSSGAAASSKRQSASSRKAKASAGGASVLARLVSGRVRKNLSALLEEELAKCGGGPGGRTAYERAQVAPSRLPARQFCAVCGHLGPHTCVLCGARFCSAGCYATHQDTRCLKWTG